MSELEEKLRELDAERSELVEFQQLDRKRRCLQYTIYDKDLSKALGDITKVRTSLYPAHLQKTFKIYLPLLKQLSKTN